MVVIVGVDLTRDHKGRRKGKMLNLLAKTSAPKPQTLAKITALYGKVLPDTLVLRATRPSIEDEAEAVKETYQAGDVLPVGVLERIAADCGWPGITVRIQGYWKGKSSQPGGRPLDGTWSAPAPASDAFERGLQLLGTHGAEIGIVGNALASFFEGLVTKGAAALGDSISAKIDDSVNRAMQQATQKPQEHHNVSPGISQCVAENLTEKVAATATD